MSQEIKDTTIIDDEIISSNPVVLMVANKLREKHREEIKFITERGREELARKSARIAELERECVRLFDPTREFWNQELLKDVHRENKKLSDDLRQVRSENLMLKARLVSYNSSYGLPKSEV